MSPDMLNVLLNSPVIVAVVGVFSAIAANYAKKPKSDSLAFKKSDDEAYREESTKKIDELVSINRNLDRHINNSQEPFRKQMNDKLDSISTSVESLLEASKSANNSIHMLDKRVSSIEERTNDIEERQKAEFQKGAD